ncbi:MAG: hypothetical protein AAB382_06005 [Chloroflexota bacterium]
MVHALEGIYRLLRPDGCLIAIRPVSGASLIEAHQGGRVLFAEPVPVPPEEYEVIAQAEDALAQVVQRRLFIVDGSGEFKFLTYAASAAELRDSVAQTNAFHEGPRDEAVTAWEAELLARVEEIMRAAGEGAEVVLHDKARIARLRPVRG